MSIDSELIEEAKVLGFSKFRISGVPMVLVTQEELDKILDQEYKRGVKYGKSYDIKNNES